MEARTLSETVKSNGFKNAQHYKPLQATSQKWGMLAEIKKTLERINSS